MKIKIFGYEIKIQKSDKDLIDLSRAGANAKTEKTLTTIYATLHDLEARQLKYSEYRLQKESNLSLNTIKKYRPQIEKYRSEIKKDLFSS